MGKAKIIKQAYHPDHIHGQKLIIAATDDLQVNRKVSQDAEDAGLLVNVVDQKSLCNFIMPSIVSRGALTLSISSSGAAPVLARMLREKLEWMLPQNLENQLVQIEQMRAEVANRYASIEARRKFWEAFFEKLLGWSVAENIQKGSGVNLDVEQLFNEMHNHNEAAVGEICCIDLGDGNTENLTVSTVKKLQKVDEIYLSKALEKKYENLIRRDAIRHFFELSTAQANSLLEDKTLINELTHHALAGKNVCLLNLNNQYEDKIDSIRRVFSENSALKIQLNRAIRG